MTPEEALQVFTDVKRAYELAFAPPAGPAIMLDLKSFCRADETCVVPGDRDRTYVLEGRREVWLRINDYLTLSAEDLMKKYTKQANGANDAE